jgi:hypothetical protein
MALFLDFGPGLDLRLGWSGKAPGKPARYRWMEDLEIHRDGYYTCDVRLCIAETNSHGLNGLTLKDHPR